MSFAWLSAPDPLPQVTRNSSPGSSCPSSLPKTLTPRTFTLKFTALSPVPVSLPSEVGLEVEARTMGRPCYKSDLMVGVLVLESFEAMEVRRGSRRRLCKG